MSFNTALSGLNAAQSDLSVTSNNIANVNTTGFKESRAQFGDIFATSALGSARTAIGSGVLLSSVSQQFAQGNLNFTNNTLDMAVSGEGFFVLTPNLTSSERIYTRAGAFGVDNNGFVVNASGQVLQAFPVNPDGSVTATSLFSTIPLQLPQTAGTPSLTSEVEIGTNLSASANGLNVNSFDPLQPTTFSSSTSLSFFDSLGQTHIGTFHFVKDQATPNSWAVYYSVDGNPVDIAGGTAGAGGQLYGRLTFDNNGNLQSSVPAAPLGIFTTAPLGFTNGADPAQTLTLDFGSNTTTQYASPFIVNTLSQDGFGVGRLTGINISDTGVVRATFSNGQSEALGKVALARFPNNQGLNQLGNTNWAETIDSGTAIAGEAGTSNFGLVRSGALESSNVDLTRELVDLITAQRNFQANARSIETSNAITQTIVQIR
ncbi:flagellar hook protein FlgE [Permianibacter aggregans]|uniref:Flagellar hook protein FlgE n=1 Tax=Permianibacter aggregans TaxID=1510150 RepID=A0A4R6UNC1_9GAMM|nr:flagellar hook protein FlgE [Permianibacter aggregans]QGX38302.1 flagellar hook protein FlgE [Permianibacter aggregans]TDQ48620.1 flagellar hook protein FlgE [Permianibacter aggregans]